MKKNAFVITLYLAIVSCNTNQYEEPAIDSLKLADSIKAANSTEMNDTTGNFERDKRFVEDSILQTKKMSFSKEKVFDYDLFKYYTYCNDLHGFTKQELLSLLKKQMIKPDLYVLNAEADYNENYEIAFIVKFINLTPNTIKSIQISDIRNFESMYPYTKQYFESHRFFRHCNIAPYQIKEVAFSFSDEEARKNVMMLDKGAKGLIHGLDFFTEEGEHFKSTDNVFNNIKWIWKHESSDFIY